MKIAKHLMYMAVGMHLFGCASTVENKHIKSLSSNNESYVVSEEEQRLLVKANKLHDSFVEKGLVLRDELANHYVQAIVSNVAPHITHPSIKLNFFILKDATINAFALPNGNIYLNMGLISRLTSEAQLAHVISHEIAHVVERHGLKGMIDRKSTVVAAHVTDLFLMGTGFVYFAAIADLASYSRQMEAEADDLALRNQLASQYDLNDSLVAFKLLKEVKHGNEGSSIWSTHPNIEQRLQQSQQTLKNLAWQYREVASSSSDYETFRRPIALQVIKIRLRNKQYELAEDIVKQELKLTQDNAILHYYLGEINRLKVLEPKAYALEYAWLYDVTYNQKLEEHLLQDRLTFLAEAKKCYMQAQLLDPTLVELNKGLGLLAWQEGKHAEAKVQLRKYLQNKNIKDRRYINSLLKTI